MDNLILEYLDEFKTAKMGDFEKLLENFRTREQVKYIVERLLKNKTLIREGRAKGTRYKKGI
ncbi:MAG: hypothetical protein IPN18_08455 [Ignavibacteriales bacterium]|nr:hypothetical protein [Ignavibacteriales bacterium]